MPSISLIIPNYNGGQFLQECFESILATNHTNLQLIVVDGGSTDKSVEIIRRFEEYVDWWVSEPDSGQSEAINKGFARAEGDIVNWLCSDDLLSPQSLDIVACHFVNNSNADVLVGACETLFTETGRRAFWRPEAAAFEYLPCINPCPQPSTFYRRSLIDRNPPIRQDLHYAMDFELWNYFKSRGANFDFIPDLLTTYRMTGENKTSIGGEKAVSELWQIVEKYHPEGYTLRRDYEKQRYRLDLARKRHPSKLFWKITTPIYQIATRRLEKKYGAETIDYLSRQILFYAT